jgi:hypothetical protein
VAGKINQDNADLLLQKTKMINDGSLHIFFSDQRPHYKEAILKSFGRLVQPKRRGTRGPLPKPCLEPPPDLLYAQVVKHRRKGRVVKVTERVVFGTSVMLQAYLDRSPVSQHLNTAFVERQNGTMRHQNRRFTRKTLSFSKKDYWIERQASPQSRLLSFLLGSRWPARRNHTSDSDQRQWFAQKMATGDPSDGDWRHRSQVDSGRTLDFPCPNSH